MLKLLPQCDSIWKWCLWEVIRFGQGHEYGAQVMGFLPLYEDEGTGVLSLSLSLLATWGPSEKAAVYKSKSKPSWTTGLPVPCSWTFQLSKLWEINVYCLKHPVYGIIVLAAWTDWDRPLAQGCGKQWIQAEFRLGKPGKENNIYRDASRNLHWATGEGGGGGSGRSPLFSWLMVNLCFSPFDWFSALYPSE